MTSVWSCGCRSAEATGQTVPGTFQSAGVMGLLNSRRADWGAPAARPLPTLAGICECFSLTSVFLLSASHPASVPVWEAAHLASQLPGTLCCFPEALWGPLLEPLGASLLHNPRGMHLGCPVFWPTLWGGRWDSSHWVSPAGLSQPHRPVPGPHPCHLLGSQPPAPPPSLSLTNALSTEAPSHPLPSSSRVAKR